MRSCTGEFSNMFKKIEKDSGQILAAQKSVGIIGRKNDPRFPALKHLKFSSAKKENAGKRRAAFFLPPSHRLDLTASCAMECCPTDGHSSADPSPFKNPGEKTAPDSAGFALLTSKSEHPHFSPFQQKNGEKGGERPFNPKIGLCFSPSREEGTNVEESQK